MSITRLASCALLIASVWIVGCVTRPSPDPLAGWKYLFHTGQSHFAKAVVDDYQDYIHKLPPAEARVVDYYSISEYEDSTGQHAVKIETPINGVYREHVL